MLRVAMLSKWHVHADGYAKRLQAMPGVTIRHVWDEQPDRGIQWARDLGALFEPHLPTLLARDDVDAVIVDAPTSLHPELIIRAAQAGKHIFTEKVMALTLADCDRIIEAVRKAGVVFTISYPHRCRPVNLYLKKAIEDGLLGKITLLRIRNAHNGALAGWLPEYWYDPDTTGGGAMMDLGAHPMYLARWFLGKPLRIQSMFNAFTRRNVDDNAVCTIEFEDRAIAISETSLVSPMSPYFVEAYGTEGVVYIRDNTLEIRSTRLPESKDGFIQPELPEALPEPLAQFVASVTEGAPVRFGLEEGRQLTELMQYAYQADHESREIIIP